MNQLVVGPLTLLAAALVGCGVEAPGLSQPDWFESHEALPACVEVDLDQGELVPDSAVTCLLEGKVDAGRELVVRGLTAEGDPRRTYYRQLHGVAGLDIITDATQDQNGSFSWHWQTCPDATSVQDVGECTVRAVEPR